jgi:hypothetical protein
LIEGKLRKIPVVKLAQKIQKPWFLLDVPSNPLNAANWLQHNGIGDTIMKLISIALFSEMRYETMTYKQQFEVEHRRSHPLHVFCI